MEAREYIAKLGPGYLPEKANEYKGKKERRMRMKRFGRRM